MADCDSDLEFNDSLINATDDIDEREGGCMVYPRSVDFYKSPEGDYKLSFESKYSKEESSPKHSQIVSPKTSKLSDLHTCPQIKEQTFGKKFQQLQCKSKQNANLRMSSPREASYIAAFSSKHRKQQVKEDVSKLYLNKKQAASQRVKPKTNNLRVMSHDEMSPQASIMTAKSKDRTEVLSDSSIDSVKDFKQAYNKLAKTLISSSSQKKTNPKARLLITDKSVGDFKRQQESKILQNQSTSGVSIHDRLYKEKEKYFENKNRDNSQKKLEEELSLCTFSPQLKGDRPKRTFDQVYRDLVACQVKSQNRKEEFKMKLLRDEQQKMQDDMQRSRSRSRESSLTNRNLSPQQLRMKLYEQGKQRLKDINRGIISPKGTLLSNSNLTFSPTISKRTKLIASKRKTISKLPQIKEDVGSDQGLASSKSFRNLQNQKEPCKTKVLKSSARILDQKITKDLSLVLEMLGHSQLTSFDLDQAFQVLQSLGYAEQGDKEYLAKVLKMFSPQGDVNEAQLRVIICGIENLQLEKLAFNQVLYPEVLYTAEASRGKQWQLANKQDFQKFHQSLQRFSINKSQFSYKNKILKAFSPSKIPRNSQQFAKDQSPQRREELSSNVQSQTSHHRRSLSSDRTQQLLEKGKHYQNKVKEKQLMKQEKELLGCTFKPKVHDTFNFSSPQYQSRHGSNERNAAVFSELYHLSTANNRKKRDKPTEEVEYEKGVQECTFKPNLKKTLSNLFAEQSSPRVKSPVASKQASPRKPNIIQSKPKTKMEPRADLSLEVKEQIKNRNLLHQYVKDPMKGQTLQQEQQAPVLYLEVNITDGFKAKLMVFEGDDPEQVVTTFGEVYNLTQTKKNKLMSIVNKQMRNILVKIGETEEEEDDSNRNAQGQQ